MQQPVIHHFRGRDGAPLTYRQVGTGWPLVLIHGFMSTAMLNWIRHGHADTIADRGYQVILPDLRGHGHSARADGPDPYPPDVLADDGLALIDHLGLTDYDLGGYSLGARTAVRLVTRGARPRRLVVGGMGLAGLEHNGGSDHFTRVLSGPDTFPPGSEEQKLRRFVRLIGQDPLTLLRVLDSSVATPRAEIERIAVPTLVVVGAEDNGFRPSTDDLVAVLPDARLAVVPGNHTSCIGFPNLGTVIAEFLGVPPRASAA